MGQASSCSALGAAVAEAPVSKEELRRAATSILEWENLQKTKEHFSKAWVTKDITQTHLQRLGGRHMLEILEAKWHQKLVGDPRLSRLLEGVDAAPLRLALFTCVQHELGHKPGAHALPHHALSSPSLAHAATSRALTSSLTSRALTSRGLTNTGLSSRALTSRGLSGMLVQQATPLHYRSAVQILEEARDTLLAERGFAPEDFDAALSLAGDTMREMGAPDYLAEEVVAHLREYKDVVFDSGADDLLSLPVAPQP
ncbi:hypothetical protein HYH03_015588 [Edaphochlamys debaryana]|uniref:Uncharacterized protein n=1 Tax=Edaphochlamys debaryana TaxID=47281 RepID=A0A835XKC7_9CHLO|nr:hypothetical protein HYH03_015588 [Edaphochlamys debaryana]|eukprot:KAG2485703.1 hypothetical protein HYH03_015588 [Edaphochlamys debaryana]